MKLNIYSLLLGAICILILQSPVRADGESEFLVFVSADDLERRSVSQTGIPTSDFTPAVDFLFSYMNGPWRFLGEYFLTDDEHELERLQIGYDHTANSSIWLGRFHQPSSAWNNLYHHGAYLQPSISRPAIENWEDDGGVIASHITGLMLDAWQARDGSSGIRYLVAAGIAPRLTDSELIPFDLLDPDDSSGNLAANLNVAYYPDIVGESNFGAIVSYSEILADPIAAFGIENPFVIRQLLLGGQVNWEWDDWQIISAAYYVDNTVERSVVAIDDAFFSAYLQLARTLGASTNGYLRLEKTSDTSSDSYLQLFPNFVAQRELLGFRYDFAERQAIALEFSRNEISMDDFSELRLQWSATFP